MFLPQNINHMTRDLDVSDIQFINIAYRPEPKVATGGPNGVLKVLQENLGTSYKGFIQRYYYEPNNIDVGKHLDFFNKNKKLGTITRKLLEADVFVQQELCKRVPFNFVDFNRKFIFICHDIGSAVGAYHAGFEYVLIYHQQGAFYFERESFGEMLSPEEKAIINDYEKIAFNNAYKVYFPSIGAKCEFLSTTTNKISTLNFSKSPLYNTVPDINLALCVSSGRKLIHKYGISKYFTNKLRNRYIIFMSIGDYSFNKGHDVTFKILDKLADSCNSDKKSDKKIVWIVCGTAHKSGIYETINESSKKSKIECCLIPKREDHDGIMYILSLVDAFIMMQRHAIFDFSTLEAMQLGKLVFLSKTGGNLDFNKENNIVYLNKDNVEESVNIISQSMKIKYEFEVKNKNVFDNFFSKNNFIGSYLDVYGQIIDDNIINKDYEDYREKYNLYYKDQRLISKIKNKDILIIGPGESLSKIDKFNVEDYTVIALNSAYTCFKKIDIHCCQDNPPEDLLNIYLEPNNVLRLYGKIGRKAFINSGLALDLFDDDNYIISTYMLSQYCYDAKTDNLDSILNTKIIYDMRSVLFSAIQVCSILQAKSISLIGIDFSDSNINGKNPNKYNDSVYESFYEILKYLKRNNVTIKKIITKSRRLYDIYTSLHDEATIELLGCADSIIHVNNMSEVKAKPEYKPDERLSLKQKKLRKLKNHPILYFKDFFTKHFFK